MKAISNSRLKRFWALFYARNLEFMRDRSSLSWNLFFPLLLITGFAIVFGVENKTLYKAGVLGELSPDLQSAKHLEWVIYESKEEALIQLKRHQVDLVIEPKASRYWVNPHSPNSYILEKVLIGINPYLNWTAAEIEGKALRYVDWALPGILGMNMMFSCLFGVGYVIVRYRKNGVLKRLKATPINAYEFLSAQVLSRLILTLSISIFLFSASDVLFDFFMEGHLWLLFLVAMLGAISMISLGLMMASRTRSEELAGGLLNIVSWPMMFLSEALFSLEGSPEWLLSISQIFPLTHLIHAARDIMITGAGFMEVLDHIAIMIVITLVCIGVGAWLFRWDQD